MICRFIFSRAFLIALSIVFCSSLLSAQTIEPRENQFNIWNGLEISKELGSRLELSISPQIRYSLDQIKKYFGEASLQFKLFKNVKLGAAYRYEQNKKKKEGYKNIQRYSFNIKASKDLGDFKASVRLRYTNDRDFEDLETSERLRYKFELGYDIPKSKLEPEIVWEIFQSLGDKELVKHRIGTGMKYKINKRTAINAAYLLDYSLDKSRNIHITTIKFQYEI